MFEADVIKGLVPNAEPRVRVEAPAYAILLDIVDVSKSLRLAIELLLTSPASTMNEDVNEDNSESTKKLILFAAR